MRESSCWIKSVSQKRVKMIMVSIFLLIFSFLSYGLPIDSEANEFLVHYLPVKSYAGQIPIERPGQNVTVQKMFFW